jgi:chemotaxis protein CheX
MKVKMGEPNLKEELSYQIIKGEGHTVIKLNGSLPTDEAKLFEKEIPTLADKPFQHMIINCTNLSDMPLSWVRQLVTLEREIKKSNKEIRFIAVRSEVLEFFKAQGVDRVFKSCSTLRDALVALKLVTKRALDTDFINPFLEATMKVLKVQTQTDAIPGKIYLKNGKDSFSGDISGVIGLVSDSFNGSVVISFPESSFLKIMSRMLGEEYKEMTKDIVDGAGELTNIIFGQAKVALNEKGYGINTALPSVVTGHDHTVKSLTKGQIVIVPFETDCGPFFVEICLSA